MKLIKHNLLIALLLLALNSIVYAQEFPIDMSTNQLIYAMRENNVNSSFSMGVAVGYATGFIIGTYAGQSGWSCNSDKPGLSASTVRAMLKKEVANNPTAGDEAASFTILNTLRNNGYCKPSTSSGLLSLFFNK